MNGPRVLSPRTAPSVLAPPIPPWDPFRCGPGTRAEGVGGRPVRSATHGPCSRRPCGW